MAGIYWTKSLTQELNNNGEPIIGARLFFFEAGTTTPLITYQDYTLATPHPNPVRTDSNGRWPNVFIDDENEFYKFRITSPSGVTLATADYIPLSLTGGGGGGDPVPPVDQTALAQTGDEKIRFDTGPISGWVRENGRTIGSSTSGATERADADTQELFEYLWNKNLSFLAVSGGRGASAVADWTANKSIQLPDSRGRVLAGLDGMGAGLAARITAQSITGSGTGPNIVGSGGGAETNTLTISEIPVHDHGGGTGEAGAHTHTLPKATGSGGGNAANNGPQDGVQVYATSSAGNHVHIIPPAGGGQPHNNMPPFTLRTIYIKL